MQHVSSVENAWIWVEHGVIKQFGSLEELSPRSIAKINENLPLESSISMVHEEFSVQSTGSDEHLISGQINSQTAPKQFTFNHPLELDIPLELSDDFPGVVFDSICHFGGMEVLPGFVDSHTHIVFAEPRTEEFKLRIQGAGYEEIAAAGGGILNSAKKLQKMEEETLLVGARNRLHQMVAHGTTTVEIKSGYGLTVESELTQLKVIRALKSEFPGIVKATFLGAHAFPKEYKGREDEYVNLIVSQMLPAVVNEGLADHMDVFCDRGFFTPEQTDVLLKAAKSYGLPAKIHANELGITGGVQKGVENGAWSVDHLEFLGEEEIRVLKDSLGASEGETVPVALPGCSHFLGIPFSNVRGLMLAGLPVALATDFNPGSSPVCSLQMIWSLACTKQKMFPSEAFHAITCNAARALRLESKVGSIAPGMDANFIATDLVNAIETIPYFFGQNHVRAVFILGKRWRN